jgi:hypothetical protein
MIDPTLGNVNLACARWPAFNKGKQLALCLPCMQQNTVMEGAGRPEQAPMTDVAYLSSLPIEVADTSLIGRSWNEREDKLITFTLFEIKWVFLDSSDGTHLPTLVGYYATCANVSMHDMEWSTMEEIRNWILFSEVTGVLSARESRALHRAASAKERDRKNASPSSDTSPPIATDMEEDETYEVNALRAGYVLREILQRATMPDGSINYQVTYEVGSKTIHVWEPATSLPPSAIARWKQQQSSSTFRYTSEEIEVQKKCAGSLKEGQTVITSGGIFVTILNCGIIVSLSILHGHESLSQIYSHLTELYAEHGDMLPDDFGYDAGCHLRKFSDLRKDKTPRAKSFWNRVGRYIFVDRFHWRNHKDTHAYCTEFCNPYNNSRLDGANTEICEQSFRWFARHKYSINNMTPGRFRFFLTILADRRNEIIMTQRGVGVDV